MGIEAGDDSQYFPQTDPQEDPIIAADRDIADSWPGMIRFAGGRVLPRFMRSYIPHTRGVLMYPGRADGEQADRDFQDGWVMDETDPEVYFLAAYNTILDSRPQIDPRQTRETPRIVLGFMEKDAGILHAGDVVIFHRLSPGLLYLETIPVKAALIQKTLVYYDEGTGGFNTAPHLPDNQAVSRRGRVDITGLNLLDDRDIDGIDKGFRQSGFESAGKHRHYRVRRIIPLMLEKLDK